MHTAARISTQRVCRFYAHSGTCRSQRCGLPHVRAAEDTVSASHASYDERHWSLSSTEEDEADPGQPTWRFSVASYNILADKYARHYRSYLYDAVPHTWLEWHHRRAAILAELSYLQPDIICLQEVDRYEDLEEELHKLGYSGIYLQRDGGRRDGCATCWRHSLLRPAVVHPVRFSHHDLKDNVALLVLFEPCHSTAQHGALRPVAAAAAAAAGGCQEQGSAWQQQGDPQQQQQQYGESPKPGGVLSQWLPTGWLWSNGSNSSSASSARSSQLLLRPVHPSQADATGSQGSMYQVPTQLQAQQQQQQEEGDDVPAGAQRTAEAAPGAPHSSGGVRRGHRRHGSSSSRRQSLEQHMQRSGQGDTFSADATQREQHQQQPAPDWARCGLLVANTHIIFTPEKGEVKLGQARMLAQEVSRMAQWYLKQQQQQQRSADSTANGDGSSSDAAAAAGGADGSSACGTVLPAGTQAVAAILTGDFNATPHSPLYAFMANGVLDLQKVNKGNVSHMVGSSHQRHHKGYRAYRKANRRRSAELQQQQQEEQQEQQQQQEAMGAAGYQQQHALQPVVAAVTAAQPEPYSCSGGAAAGQAQAQDAASSSSSGWRASSGAGHNGGGGSSSSSTQTTCAVDILPRRNQNGSSMQRQDSGGRSSREPFVAGGSPPAVAASPQRQVASSPQQQQQGSWQGGQKHYRWSDWEIKRAAGMSYDELVEASMSLLSESEADSPDVSCDDQIRRAAAAFGATAAAGSGAAAAASAAAAAASAAGVPGSSPAKGWFAGLQRSNSGGGGQPLLLQHGLKLRSSYQRVLGQEPDYTSSHSQFMDTCDYIWYTSSPLTHPQQQQHQQGGGSSSGSGAHERFELRPVAVLQPPDGMRLPKGLPSKSLGSDHICLLTDFELVLKQPQQQQQQQQGAA